MYHTTNIPLIAPIIDETWDRASVVWEHASLACTRAVSLGQIAQTTVQQCQRTRDNRTRILTGARPLARWDSLVSHTV